MEVQGKVAVSWWLPSSASPCLPHAILPSAEPTGNRGSVSCLTPGTLAFWTPLCRALDSWPQVEPSSPPVLDRSGGSNRQLWLFKGVMAPLAWRPMRTMRQEPIKGQDSHGMCSVVTTASTSSWGMEKEQRLTRGTGAHWQIGVDAPCLGSELAAPRI